MSGNSDTRFRIVANPTAGQGGAARLAVRLRHLLEQSGAQASVHLTGAKGQAESVARAILEDEARRVGGRVCLVACGGDGTVQEVANALLADGRQCSLDVTLGLAPAGRCNDFASAFGIQARLADIAEVLLRGRTTAVDLGRVNQRYFCTVAAMGFDAAVSRFVNDMKMPLSGTLAYMYGILRVLPVYQPAQVHLVMDGSTMEGPVYLAASANTSSYGGRLHICPGANARDGMLDLCLVAPLSRWRVLRLLHRVLRRRHTDLPEVRLIRTRSLRIESPRSQEIWADGEFVTRTPATVEAVPSALRMMVPATTVD